ncbi:hypothetical protein ACYSUW_14650 [Pseudomonas frederiksbergensis]
MRILIAVALVSLASVSNAACSLSDIRLTSVKAKFVNRCSTDACFYLQGAGMLENSCAESVGVQLKIIGYDKAGAPVAVNDFWPSSVQNIPPGSYSFSLDQHLKYDPAISKIELKTIRIEKWD